MHAILVLDKGIPHDRYQDFEANIACFIFCFFNNLIIIFLNFVWIVG